MIIHLIWYLLYEGSPYCWSARRCFNRISSTEKRESWGDGMNCVLCWVAFAIFPRPAISSCGWATTSAVPEQNLYAVLKTKGRTEMPVKLFLWDQYQKLPELELGGIDLLLLARHDVWLFTLTSACQSLFRYHTDVKARILDLFLVKSVFVSFFLFGHIAFGSAALANCGEIQSIL